ncbi:MAG: hypothetical protein C5B55_08640 [Blastocatellia bacterium]|nr:MAG: hypothetical protein C5B55_08640 [Blastocatellia bacterium]
MTIIVVAVFGSAALHSNSQSILGVRARIPFDFMVGDQIIPAGMVSARGVNTSNAGTLSITNHSVNENIVRIGHRLPGTNITKQGKLVFHRYGDRYYLAEVWVPGYKAWQVEESNSERAMKSERRFARNTRPRVVTVLAEIQ